MDFMLLNFVSQGTTEISVVFCTKLQVFWLNGFMLLHFVYTKLQVCFDWMGSMLLHLVSQGTTEIFILFYKKFQLCFDWTGSILLQFLSQGTTEISILFYTILHCVLIEWVLCCKCLTCIQWQCYPCSHLNLLILSASSPIWSHNTKDLPFVPIPQMSYKSVQGNYFVSPGYKYEENFKVGLRETVFEVVDWINLTWIWYRGRSFMSSVMNIQCQ
jgi:hypothetical protein